MSLKTSQTDPDTRWQQRLKNFEAAHLEFANASKMQRYSKLERSGLIQTFEFTFELAWKTLQDFLLTKGYQDIAGPRPVIQQAFKDGIIGSGEDWMKMLISRNLTVHSYNESTAQEIAELIKSTYEPLLTQLVHRLQKERMSSR